MNDKKLRPGERLVEGKDTSGQEQETAQGHVTAVRRNDQLLTTDLSENVNTLSSAHTRTDLDHLTLHEERASVQVIREQAGSVQIRRVVRERQEVIPVTLTTETLEITVQDGAGQLTAGKVTLNGEELEPGRTYEILIHDERAVVEKQVFALSQVNLSKQTRTFTHTEEVTLGREELEVSDPQGLVRDIQTDER